MIPFMEESNRIYINNENGLLMAEAVFPQIDADTVDLNHTFVDDSLRGQGVAGRLLEAAAQKIRRENKKVIPSCSYAAKWFEKNSQYSDILKL